MRRGGVVIFSAWLAAAAGCSEASQSAPEYGSSKASAAKNAPILEGPTELQTGAATSAPSARAPNTAEPNVSSMPFGRKPVVFQAYASNVEDELKKDDVAKTFDDSATKLTDCLTTDTSLRVNLRILPTGVVSDASVDNLQPNEPRVRDCLVAALRKLTFPKRSSREAATVTLDLALQKG